MRIPEDIVQQPNVKQADSEYSAIVETVKCKRGVNLLNDDDLTLLALDEISHTFTRDERNYS
jgi:hypothetical protein